MGEYCVARYKYRDVTKQVREDTYVFNKKNLKEHIELGTIIEIEIIKEFDMSKDALDWYFKNIK